MVQGLWIYTLIEDCKVIGVYMYDQSIAEVQRQGNW